MPSPISPFQSIPPIPDIAPARVRNAPPDGFSEVLNRAMETVGGLHDASGDSIDRFLSGEGEELHQTALAVQRAELAFELALQVRNKVVSAYQEVMRMQM